MFDNSILAFLSLSVTPSMILTWFLYFLRSVLIFCHSESTREKIPTLGWGAGAQPPLPDPLLGCCMSPPPVLVGPTVRVTVTLGAWAAACACSRGFNTTRAL